MSAPIFDAVVADLCFDPASVPPTQTYAERNLEHDIWLKAAVARVAAKRLRKAVAK